MKETPISLDDGPFSMKKTIESVNNYNHLLNTTKDSKKL
jgi:hypothetical protein